MTPRQRLLRRIVKQDGPGECWIWTGARSANGYGYIWASGKTYYTHRLAFQLWKGAIPQGHYVYHHCNNPICCNPKHLFTSRGVAGLEQRLLQKIEKQQPSGCWIWRGHIQKGFGRVELPDRKCRAVHRLAFELWGEGPIPDNTVLLHLCGQRLCCNPDHLVAGTPQECAQYMLDCRRKDDDHPSRAHIGQGEGQAVTAFIERI